MLRHVTLACLAVAFSSAPAQADYPPQFLLKWGSFGSGPGQFHEPSGMAIDAAGEVYIADSQNQRVQKFTNDGVFLTQWGSVAAVYGVAVSPAGNVYVAGLDRVQEFDGDGAFLIEWTLDGTGGQFAHAEAVEVDRDGFVFVVDAFKDRVSKFDANGGFIMAWGSPGSGDGEFDYPRDLAIDADGNVYVAESANQRVQKFDANGVYVTKWGSVGTGDGQFSFSHGAYGIAVDAGNRVYVSDMGNNRIQEFDGNGTYMTQWGSSGTDNGQFDLPKALAVDGSGNIFVEEFGSPGGPTGNRVQKFGFLPVPVTRSTWGWLKARYR